MNNDKKTINMSFRVNKDLKEQADELFKKLGLNTSTAVNMFFNQCVREQGIPFVASVKTPAPSSELMKSLKEAEQIVNDENRKGYNTINDFMRSLDD